MRKIKQIILHCSASDREDQTAKMIDAWHKERGWSRIGYHYFIRKNGLIEGGRAVEDVGAHVRGLNKSSVGICLAGDKKFRAVQFRSLKALLDSLRETCPQARVYGHNEFDKKKLCPVFNVSRFKDYWNKGEEKWKFLSIFLKFLKRS